MVTAKSRYPLLKKNPSQSFIPYPVTNTKRSGAITPVGRRILYWMSGAIGLKQMGCLHSILRSLNIYGATTRKAPSRVKEDFLWELLLSIRPLTSSELQLIS